jgi:hypothetical protein
MPETDESTVLTNTSEGAVQASPSVGESSGETTPAAEAANAANPQPSADAVHGSLPSQTRSATQTPPNAVNPQTAPGTQKPPAPAAAPLDYEKQYKAILPEYTRATQLASAYKQLPPIDQLQQQLSRLQEMEQQQQKRAEAERLKTWNPRHPEFQATTAAISRVKSYRSAARAIPANLPPEQRQEIARSMAQELGVTEQDAQLFKNWEAHQGQVQERMAQDPEGFFQEVARQVAQQVVQEYEQFTSVRSQTQEFLTNNQELVKAHAKEIDWAMNHPARREVGIEFARLKAENEALKANQANAMESKETAEAQKALTKQRNTFRRDSATAPIEKDPVAEAAKLGMEDPQALADFLIRQRRKTTA